MADGQDSAVSLIQAHGLTFSYPPDNSHRLPSRPSLWGELSFGLKPGEILHIQGSSGAGKSTLLHLLAGLLRPTSGYLKVCDLVLSPPAPITGGGNSADQAPVPTEASLSRWRNRCLGLVSQEHFLDENASVLDNLMLPACFSSLPWDSARKRAGELMERLDIASWGLSSVRCLSGGQRRRVALARALTLKPRLLLADEPFNDLDARLAGELASLLQEICRQDGLGLVLATHVPVAGLSPDRTLRLDAPADPEERETVP